MMVNSVVQNITNDWRTMADWNLDMEQTSKKCSNGPVSGLCGAGSSFSKATALVKYYRKSCDRGYAILAPDENH